MKDILENNDLDDMEKAFYYDLRYSSGERNEILSKALFEYRTRKQMISRKGGSTLFELKKYETIDFEFSEEMRAFLRSRQV